MSKEYPWGKGTVQWVRDATLNDSDKTFTVPSGKIWVPIRVSATLQNTATVGSRNLNVYVYDATPNIVWRTVGIASTASQNSTYNVGFGNYIPTTTAVAKEIITTGTGINAGIQENAGQMILTAGFSIRVWDSAAIDAAADDLTVVLHYVEYDA